MKETISRLLLSILLMCGTSCSLQKGKSTGENAVVKFHTQFNAGQYHEIYAETDEGFRKNTSEEQMTALLGGVQRKLGLEKDTNQLPFPLFEKSARDICSFAARTRRVPTNRLRLAWGILFSSYLITLEEGCLEL